MPRAARRFYISGLGAGTSIALPMMTSMQLLNRNVPTISPLHVLSALQREQTRLDANEDPPITSAYDAAGQSDVPAVVPGTITTAATPIPMSAPMEIVGATDANGRGIIFMPPQVVDAPPASAWSTFWRLFGPPTIAATGLLVAVWLLSRKRKRS